VSGVKSRVAWGGVKERLEQERGGGKKAEFLYIRGKREKKEGGGPVGTTPQKGRGSEKSNYEGFKGGKGGVMGRVGGWGEWQPLKS